MYSLRLLPEVEDDVIVGYGWYEERLPYAIYFTTQARQVVVFGLFHCPRDPHTIRTKLRNREGSENPEK